MIGLRSEEEGGGGESVTGGLGSLGTGAHEVRVGVSESSSSEIAAGCNDKELLTISDVGIQGTAIIGTIGHGGCEKELSSGREDREEDGR